MGWGIHVCCNSIFLCWAASRSARGHSLQCAMNMHDAHLNYICINKFIQIKLYK